MLARTVALGLGWYALELALVLRSGTAVDRSEVFRIWLGLLPWQLALFGVIGIGLAVLVRALHASATTFGWLAIGAAGFAFLGARVAEGALRTTSVAQAGGALVLLAIAIAAVLAIAAACGRVLPAPLRRAWPAAIWVGASLLIVPFVRRAGASIALGQLPLREWPGFVSPGVVALSALGAAIALAIGARRARTAPRSRFGVALALVAAGALGPHPATAADPAQRPDVVLVLIDALRGDHVGARNGAASLTPNLDAIAAESIDFQRAFAPANLTRSAMPGVLASSTERVVGTPVSAEAQTLPMLLRDAGYATVGVSANPFVSAHYGYARGFDVFADPSDAPTFLVGSLAQLLLGIDQRGAAYRMGMAGSDLYYEPALRLFARGLRLFDRAARPTFLYLHAMDVHGPYLPPHRLLPASYRPGDYLGYSQFLRLSHGEVVADSFQPTLENVRQRYAAGVRNADEAVGTLRAALQARGRWDEALVWITADHGEALGENGFTGHGIGWLGPALTQVPLLLKLPRSWGLAPAVVATPVSTLDILPTTLGLLDRPPNAAAFGADLSAGVRAGSTPEDRVVVSWVATEAGDHYAAVRGRHQLALLIRRDGRRERRLHDLETDPGTTRDIAAAHPDAVRDLEAAIDAHRDREARLALAPTPAAIDPQLRERLRALGYLDDAH